VAIDDDYFKITAEGLRVAAAMSRILNTNMADIHVATVSRLQATDID